MMGTIMPKTCWAASMWLKNKFYDWLLYLLEVLFEYLYFILIRQYFSLRKINFAVFLETMMILYTAVERNFKYVTDYVCDSECSFMCACEWLYLFLKWARWWRHMIMEFDFLQFDDCMKIPKWLEK
jgi:hypothetical protein